MAEGIVHVGGTLSMAKRIGSDVGPYSYAIGVGSEDHGIVHVGLKTCWQVCISSTDPYIDDIIRQ